MSQAFLLQQHDRYWQLRPSCTSSKNKRAVYEPCLFVPEQHQQSVAIDLHLEESEMNLGLQGLRPFHWQTSILRSFRIDPEGCFRLTCHESFAQGEHEEALAY